MRLLALATHPIQYQAPWFRALAAEPGVDLEVWFGALPGAAAQGVGFGVPFAWDVPLLDGFRSEFVVPPARRGASPAGFLSIRAAGLARRLRRLEPDVVLLTGWHSLLLIQGQLAARRLGLPCLVRGESSALARRSGAVRALHRRLLAAYDAFLVIGTANCDFYRSYGIDEGRLFAAPYFVDNVRFAGQAAALAGEREALRAGWGVPARVTAVLFAGKLVEKKRLRDLFAAAAAARARGAALHLLVAGDGALRAELERFARARDVPVTFTGFLNQSEIARAYVAADLLVLPSDAGETWGLVVNEAMACGRPAIVSDLVGCGPDLVVEGETGWRFPCGNVEALAAALARAAADAPRLVAMGAAAQRRVLSAYSVERAVAGTLAACEHVLRARRGR